MPSKERTEKIPQPCFLKNIGSKAVRRLAMQPLFAIDYRKRKERFEAKAYSGCADCLRCKEIGRLQNRKAVHPGSVAGELT